MKLRLLLLSLAAFLPVLLHSAPVRHILFIGDSITHHAPAPHLGWSGDWGMAASSRDSDYVHRLVARFAAEQGVRPVFVTNAIGGGAIPGKLADRVRLAAQVAEAELVIIQMGENDNTVTPEGFGAPYEQLVRLLAGMPEKMISSGTFAPVFASRSPIWPRPTRTPGTARARPGSGRTPALTGILATRAWPPMRKRSGRPG